MFRGSHLWRCCFEKEKMNYNKEKVKRFNEYVLRDYGNSYEVNDIVNVRLVESADGTFTQIGLRHLIDDDLFTDPSMSEHLPGVGMRIAVGEMDFLIQTILEDEDIEKVKFKEDIVQFPKYVFGFREAVILLSTKFFVEVFTRLINRIDYEEKHPRLDHRYRIIPVSERILGKKIIIVDKNAIFWDKEVFENKATETKEKMDISIKPIPTGKADITIRSVNKIKYIDPQGIKILEIGT